MNRFVKPKAPAFMQVFERTDEKDHRRLLDMSVASFNDSSLNLNLPPPSPVMVEKGLEEDVECSDLLELCESPGKGDETPAPSAQSSPQQHTYDSPVKIATLDSPLRDRERFSSPVHSPRRAALKAFKSVSERHVTSPGLSRASKSERSLGASLHDTGSHRSPSKVTHSGGSLNRLPVIESPQRLDVVPESLVKHAESLFTTTSTPAAKSRKMSLFGRLKQKKDEVEPSNMPELEATVAEVSGGENAMPFAQLTLEAVSPKRETAGVVERPSRLTLYPVDEDEEGEGNTEEAKDAEAEAEAEADTTQKVAADRETKGHEVRRPSSRSTPRRKSDDDGARAPRGGERRESRNKKSGEDYAKPSCRSVEEHENRPKHEDEGNRKARIGDGHEKRRKSDEDTTLTRRSSDGHENRRKYEDASNLDQTNLARSRSEGFERRRKPSEAVSVRTSRNDDAKKESKSAKESKGGKPDDSSSGHERKPTSKATTSPTKSSSKTSSPTRTEKKLQHDAETLEWRRVPPSPSSPARRESHASRKSHKSSRDVNKSEQKDRPRVARSGSDVDSLQQNGTHDEGTGSNEPNNNSPLHKTGKLMKESPELSREGSVSPKSGPKLYQTSKETKDANDNTHQASLVVPKQGKRFDSPPKKSSTVARHPERADHGGGLGEFLNQTRSHADPTSASRSKGHRSQNDDSSVSVQSDHTANQSLSNVRGGGAPQAVPSHPGIGDASKSPTNGRRRRGAQAPSLQTTASEVPMAHSRRMPRRASTGAAAVASSGRVRRRLSVGRESQQNISAQLASALAADEFENRVIHAADSSDPEVRANLGADDRAEVGENQETGWGDSPVQHVAGTVLTHHYVHDDPSVSVTQTFDVVPFLFISKAITERDRKSGVPNDTSGLGNREQLATGEASVESHRHSESRSSQECITEKKADSLAAATTSCEFTRLSFELAQSRVRLREARMEIDQFEVEIMMLRERLLILEQRKDHNIGSNPD